MSRPLVKEKTCGKCGKVFLCGNFDGRGCWCEKFPVLPPPLTGDCFCPQCLEAEIARKQEGNS